MKKSLISFVKYNKIFLSVYKFFGNLLVKFLSLFTKVKDRRVLFVVYGGRKFDDSPKCIYEKMKDDSDFSGYEFIWAFNSPKDFPEVTSKKVKIDTLSFYKAALSSKIWITNSSVERGLKIKRKKTLEINTWHGGLPMKKIGKDFANNKNFKNVVNKKGELYLCAQNEYIADILTRMFEVGKESLIYTDFPRNDTIYRYTESDVKSIKENLGIPADKKVILYAPTFREFDRDKFNSCVIAPPIDFDKWERELGDNYVILFRAHYEVIKAIGIDKDDDFIKDVSDYKSLNDLFVISDLLISDYSSIYSDYSITGKPMLNFSYDYEKYKSLRGLYFELEGMLPCNINLTEDTLLDEIKNLDYEKYSDRTTEFCKKYCPYKNENSTGVVVDKLKELIINGNKR